MLSLTEALAGFGDPTVIFIAGLFVVSESLDATGITAWAGQKVIARAGTKRRSLLLVIGLLVAAVSALISVNGAVAALLPLVVVVAARAGLAGHPPDAHAARLRGERRVDAPAHRNAGQHHRLGLRGQS